MTIEDARLKFRAKQYYTHDGDLVIPRPYAYDIIDEIFDEHEAEIKAKDERIKELEEAIKPKTCDGCVHEVEDMQDLHCPFCSRSCDDNFEPKDNA